MKAQITKTVALASLLAGVSGAAYATEGWYGRVDVGYTFEGATTSSGTEFDLSNDWVESIGLGYAFQNGFRLEGEVSHRYNEVEATPSDLHIWAGMLNGYYDFNRDGRVQPYLGLGVGVARLSVSPINQDATDFAYQGLAGIGFAVTEQLTFDVGYRYFAVPEAEFTGGTLEDTSTQSVHVGLRWQFQAPEPPPPPPPPPAPPPPPPPPPPAVACPAADFVVYFEWDRSNLNQAALETIDAAVARARACNLGAVTVVGHTDTSGSAQYNEGLSQRRASVVADALVARGVPAASITTQARGESDLARPTRDGVREPLNRRTAVTISFY